MTFCVHAVASPSASGLFVNLDSGGVPGHILVVQATKENYMLKVSEPTSLR